LTAHKDNIKHLKLKDFKGENLLGVEFENVTHFEIEKTFASKWEPKFENLTHLVMDVNKIEDNGFLKNCKVS
jgi:hypothetical protein